MNQLNSLAGVVHCKGDLTHRGLSEFLYEPRTTIQHLQSFDSLLTCLPPLLVHPIQRIPIQNRLLASTLTQPTPSAKGMRFLETLKDLTSTTSRSNASRRHLGKNPFPSYLRYLHFSFIPAKNCFSKIQAHSASLSETNHSRQHSPKPRRLQRECVRQGGRGARRTAGGQSTEGCCKLRSASHWRATPGTKPRAPGSRWCTAAYPQSRTRTLMHVKQSMCHLQCYPSVFLETTGVAQLH